MKRLAVSLGVGTSFLLLCWYGGADFTVRGVGNALLMGDALVLVVLAYFCPLGRDK